MRWGRDQRPSQAHPPPKMHWRGKGSGEYSKGRIEERAGEHDEFEMELPQLREPSNGDDRRNHCMYDSRSQAAVKYGKTRACDTGGGGAFLVNSRSCELS